jgi:MoaA/NifB/PqqE/SkfB family radical SAM enzyme
MLSPDLVADLNRFRGLPPGTSACPAPLINLHFSQMGVVTACCFNRQQVLGIYPENSIHDIWNGKPIRELRDALARNDLSMGCQKCLQQIEARDFGGSHAVFYSVYARMTAEKRRQLGMEPKGDQETKPWPMRLEFNIHNSCNLQCVMCHGLASSAIRTRREGLPPMPNPYNDAFVDQLEPFLPYVVETDFMGGEPFLIPVYIKLWERIARINPRTKVCILTNGTILNDRIKSILDGINCWIHVSIDSIYEKTYESIRRGACYKEVMEHCDYYVELMRKRGLSVIFRFCPMRQNWREIPETVEFCNAKRVMLMYNQVDSPVNLSLHTLPISELHSVVDHLERHAPPDGEELSVEGHNHQQYMELVQRLRGFLDGQNRLNGLRARLDVSDAVVGQYTLDGKTATAETSTNALTKAAKRYLITRLNVDLARDTESQLPAEISAAVSERLTELNDLLPRTDEETFIKTFLNELIRTYSGVGGVLQVHGLDIFDKVAGFSATVAAHPDRRRLIADLVTARPGEVYDMLRTQSLEELRARYCEVCRDG